jgi:hypothetical protein
MLYPSSHKVFIEINIALDVPEAIENVGVINYLRHTR